MSCGHYEGTAASKAPPVDHGNHDIPTLPDRLRRGLLGYRTGDVLAALGHLGGQLDGLARSVDRLYLEREELRARVDGATHEREEALREQAERLDGIAAERRALDLALADQHAAEARAQAARILAEAEEQAATLRHEAGLRVGDAASRLEDLLHVREQLLGELRGLVHSYSDVLAEHETGPLERPRRQPEPAAEGPAAAPRELTVAPATGAGLYPTHVELDAGPFGDFAELSAFERALARLPKVDDVYIRGFGDERAVIELSLTEETPLAHDLTTKLPYGVRVERGEGARILVELVPEAAASGGE